VLAGIHVQFEDRVVIAEIYLYPLLVADPIHQQHPSITYVQSDVDYSSAYFVRADELGDVMAVGISYRLPHAVAMLPCREAPLLGGQRGHRYHMLGP
jgi:hypothetical protein